MQRLFHFVLMLAATLAAATVIAFLIGVGLPRDYMVQSAMTINAPQGKAWSLLEDIDGQPKWRNGLKTVERLPDDADGHRCWVEVQKRVHLPLCEAVTAAPTTRVVVVADPDLSFGATWTFNLTALTPETTEVAIAEHVTTNSPLWRFFSHYIAHEGTEIKQYEADLQRAAQQP